MVHADHTRSRGPSPGHPAACCKTKEVINYYLCEEEDEPIAQDLDEYEAKESSRLEFIDLATAINKNRNVQESSHNEMMFSGIVTNRRMSENHEICLF